MLIIVNIIYFTLLYTLYTISYALVYKVTKYFNYGHAILYPLGAYLLYTFTKIYGASTEISIVVTLIIIAIIGFIMWRMLYKNIWNAYKSSLALMLASLGVYVVIQNLLSLIYGDDSILIRNNYVVQGYNVGNAKITTIQIVVVMSSICLLVLTYIYERYTKYGKEMRAVSYSYSLSELSGINCNKVISRTYAIGAVLAGSAGIMMSYDVDIKPTMGQTAIMIGVVAMILGGEKTIWRGVYGSLIVASAQVMSIWYLSSLWQEAITFVILLIYLVYKSKKYVSQ